MLGWRYCQCSGLMDQGYGRSHGMHLLLSSLSNVIKSPCNNKFNLIKKRFKNSGSQTLVSGTQNSISFNIYRKDLKRALK